MPAYIVFSDATLREICRTLPRSKTQLAAVDGLGVFKANRYGNQILMAVRLYVPEPKQKREKKTGQNRKDTPASPRPGSFQAYKDQVIAKGSTDAYQPWAKEEDQQLIREKESGKTISEMAEIHKRTQGAIRSRLKKLELG